jgi:hypothetical protein
MALSLLRLALMPRKQRHPERPGTPLSLSDEQLARSDPRKLFTDDGRKARNTERVGAMAPDTDPADSRSPSAPRR